MIQASGFFISDLMPSADEEPNQNVNAQSAPYIPIFGRKGFSSDQPADALDVLYPKQFQIPPTPEQVKQNNAKQTSFSFASHLHSGGQYLDNQNGITDINNRPLIQPDRGKYNATVAVYPENNATLTPSTVERPNTADKTAKNIELSTSKSDSFVSSGGMLPSIQSAFPFQSKPEKKPTIKSKNIIAAFGEKLETWLIDALTEEEPTSNGLENPGDRPIGLGQLNAVSKDDETPQTKPFSAFLNATIDADKRQGDKANPFANAPQLSFQPPFASLL